jgi:hypothetical protein
MNWPVVVLILGLTFMLMIIVLVFFAGLNKIIEEQKREKK